MEIPGCRNIQIDFADDCSISSALDDIDVVIHCAGINASDSLNAGSIFNFLFILI